MKPHLWTALLLLSVSCHREAEGAFPVAYTHLAVTVDDMTADTKTLLTDPGIETKITSVTLAFYNSQGHLEQTGHFTSGFSDMKLQLLPGETYTGYALANMGDMQSVFPENITGEESLADITYTLPGYTTGGTGINARGIPMAGQTSYTADGANHSPILLQRLMAKCNVYLNCKWPGSFDRVTIHNLNKTLHPFGESRAQSSADILEDVEISTLGTAGNEGEFLFYLPENLQGSIPGIVSSDQKRADNDAVTDPQLKSYLEVTITGDTAREHNGTLVFRSYLGDNETSSFDIRRNCRYFWNLTYYPDGMVHNDWKHENHMSWKRFTYAFLESETLMFLDSEKDAMLWCYENRYQYGVLLNSVKRNTEQHPFQGTYSYWNPQDISVMNDNAVLTVEDLGEHLQDEMDLIRGVWIRSYAPGTRVISANISEGGSEEVIEKACSLTVHVLDYKNQAYFETGQGDDYTNGIDHDFIIIPTGSSVRSLLKYKHTEATGETTDHYDDSAIWEGEIQLKEGSTVLEQWSGYSGYYLDYTFDTAGYYYLEGTLTFRIDGYSLDTSAECAVVVRDEVEDRLLCDVDPYSLETDVGSGIGIKVFHHHSVNGTDPVITDVTAEADWSVSGSIGQENIAAYVTHHYNSTDGRRVFTSSKAGKCDVSITYGGAGTQLTLTYKDVTSSAFTVQPVTFTTVNTGDNLDLRALFSRTVNGITTDTNVSADASWSFVGAHTGASVSSNGRVTSSQAGHYTVRCTYSDDHLTYTKDVDVTFVSPAFAFTESPSQPHYAGSTVTVLASLTRAKEGAVVTSDVTGASAWTSGGSYPSSDVSFSGNTVMGHKRGTYAIRVTFQENGRSFTDVHDVSFNDNSYTFSLSPNPANLLAGKTLQLTYSLTKNGADHPLGSQESIVWSSSASSVASVSASGLVSGIAAGTAVITARLKENGADVTSATATVYVTRNSITLSTESSSISVNGSTTATVTWTSESASGTSSETVSGYSLKAYTTASGSTESAIVSIGNGNLTGVSSGTCYLEATYTRSGETYTSNRVQLHVVSQPLSISWASGTAPQYVAQRGKLAVSGLEDASAELTYSVLSGDTRVRISREGDDAYVECLAPGDYTLSVSCSANGQSGTLSGTVGAPILSLTNGNTYYANPDGAPVHTGSDGLSGSGFVTAYGNGSATFTVVNTATALGTTFYGPLYEELLAPVYSSSSPLLRADADGVYVQSLAGYPSAAEVTIGTVTLSPRAASVGVSSVTATVKSTHPFNAWPSTPADWGSYEDWGLLQGYYTYSDTFSRQFQMREVNATSGYYGLTVFINDTEADAEFQGLFDTVNTNVTCSLSQSRLAGLSHHKAGIVSPRVYVRNRHSGERLFRDIATFHLYVHGAVGAQVSTFSPSGSGNSYQTMRVWPVVIGQYAGTPFGRLQEGGTTYYSIKSSFQYGDVLDHNLGSCPYYIQNSQTVYSVGSASSYVLQVIPANSQHQPDGSMTFTSNDAEAFRNTTGPNLQWGNVITSELVTNLSGTLYLRNSSSDPTRTVNGNIGLGYYVLHLLADIQTSGIVNGNKGWAND